MQLFYREKGNPDNPPLILLHGLWGASDNWLTVAGLLADYFHVILPDFRNHGHSPHSPEHSYEDLSRDLSIFITSLHLPRKPFIAGHSMGGKALMLLLLKKPQIAAKAAILDIAPKPYLSFPHSIHQDLLETMTNISPGFYQHREEIHTAIRQKLPSEELCQIVFKNLDKTSTGFRWKINTEAIQKNNQDILDWPVSYNRQNYPFPILFIRGENSEYITGHDLSSISNLFPAAEIRTLPGASHFLHRDQPELLAQTLIHYFLSLPGNSILSEIFL